MTEQLYNQLKGEQREGHTPNYSALNWNLPVETILQVRRAKSYGDYVEAVQVV